MSQWQASRAGARHRVGIRSTALVAHFAAMNNLALADAESHAFDGAVVHGQDPLVPELRRLPASTSTPPCCAPNKPSSAADVRL